MLYAMRILEPEYRQDGVVVLDARISPETGQELFKQIGASVAACDGSRTILIPLPSILVVTQRQFASLNNYTQEMFHTTGRMMNTGMNVMELTIDRDVDTVADIAAVLDETERIEHEREQSRQDDQISED